MAHAWKACWVKALGGSNPPSSAPSARSPPDHHRRIRAPPSPRHPVTELRRTAITVTASTLRIVPRRSLMRTAFISIVLAMIPVFGVLYWFAVQHGSWQLVFVVHLAVSAAAIALLLRQLTVYTAVTTA